MFGTIIDTDKQGELKINPKYFALCPEMVDVYNDKNLGGPIIKYIVNVYDRKSVYRHLPFDIRKEEVCMMVFGKKTNPRISHAKTQKAIELYEFVQYDPLIDQYQSMVNKNKEKIKVYNTMRVTKDNISEINETESKMQKSTEGLEKLRERIETQEDEREILGSGVNNLSYIEERLIKFQKREQEI